jgi:thymidylate synthase ThyX
MFQPQAEIIADSVNANGDRITTYVLTYHRLIHSEFMTHRMLSKNSSSSRAIPVEKMIKLVEEQEVYPLHFGRNCRGMSAKEELESGALLSAKHWWKAAREDAISRAKTGIEIGLHKQIINRILEPYSTITVIATGTNQPSAWQNFFNQRCHPSAQPEIRALADAMKLAYDASEPIELYKDEWHVPFIIDDPDIGAYSMTQFTHSVEDIKKICVGRCARVSYLNHDGVRSLSDDIKLHDRLLEAQPPHLSPFEHCAKSAEGQHANFVGWQSYRSILETSK